MSLFIGIVFSCSKKDSDIELQNTKLKKIIYYSFTFPKTFDVKYENNKISVLESDDTKIQIFYNPSGKISEKRITSTQTGEIHWKYEFLYQSNMIYETITEYIGNSIITNKREIYYDSQNQIDSIKFYDDLNNLNSKKLFTWHNQNLISIQTFDNNNNLISNLDIEYDLNKVNKFNEEYKDFWLINEYDTSYNFELYLSKNITLSSYYSTNGVVDNTTYAYTYINGYINKIYQNSELLIEFVY